MNELSNSKNVSAIIKREVKNSRPKWDYLKAPALFNANDTMIR